MKLVIGLCGVARSGKDTFFNIAENLLLNRNIKGTKHCFAFSLKQELDKFCLEQLGFSAHTEVDSEKDLIRNVLSSWGQLRRTQCDTYWIDKIKNNFQPGVNFITDVRYQNEVKYIQAMGGKVVYINRKREDNRLVVPANVDEERYTLPIQNTADIILSWKTIDKDLSELEQNVVDILNVLVYTNPPHSI